ncbi:MAG: hypothetical protein JXN59_14265 [Anaerolineae bacterium]|nr:hypothetical protein [Anaerolineae bacterium]
MLATTPHQTLRTARPRGFRARWFYALRSWLWLLSHRARRYRIMRAYARETLRKGPMAVPSTSPMASTSTDLAFGVGRRFPLQPERAPQFYRALDEHE